MAQKSEKIGEEETKCQHMADLAQHDLDEALPALEEAMKVGHTSSHSTLSCYISDRLFITFICNGDPIFVPIDIRGNVFFCYHIVSF